MSLLATVQEQLQNVDELIANLDSAMASDANPRPSVAANIRALEKERRTLQSDFMRAAELSEVDVYRYRIIPHRRATIEGLTSAWQEFQRMLNTVYNSLRAGGQAPTRKRKSFATTDEIPQSLELGFGYSFNGSIGIAMTLPRTSVGLFPGGDIEQATNNVFDVATANDHARLTALARRLGPSPIDAVYKWADCHVRYGFGVGIEWRRDAEHSRDVVVQLEELTYLKEELYRTTIDTRIDVTGELVVVDAVNGTFTIQTDDGVSIIGDYADAITKEQAARVPARYAAVITKSTQMVRVGGDVKRETFFLKELTAL